MEKIGLCTITGIIGSISAYFFGEFDAGLEFLLICMTTDIITGLIVAGICKNSKKTDSGSLSSIVGFKGLGKKVIILCFVVLGYRIDNFMGTKIVKNGIELAFIINELLSIIENAGLIGVPVPKVLKNAIDVLQTKDNESDNILNQEKDQEENEGEDS